MKTTETYNSREKSLLWWRKLLLEHQYWVLKKNDMEDRQVKSLTGREIEEIWRKEIAT